MSETISFPYLGLSFNVDKVAFTLFGISVRWYGVIIGVGILAAFIYALYAVKTSELSQDDLLNMTIIALPCAIVGARLYYVIFNWDYYKDDLMGIFAIRNGGLAIYGGIIAAAIVIIVYCKCKKIKLGAPFDLLAVGLPIAQSIGRWGNFVNGEAYGGHTSLPIAMSIGNYAKCVHPTFLYESLWNAAGVIIILLIKRKGKLKNRLFCVYMIWYGIGRFFIEGMRTDSLYLGVFRISQIVSLAIIALGIGILIYFKYKKEDKI